MQPYSKEQLVKLNQIGLIPGPLESIEEFTKRADYCLHLKNFLVNDIQASEMLGLKAETEKEAASIEALQEAAALLSKNYAINLKWIPIFYSNFQLPLWHGGSAWIFQLKEDSPTAALVQLRKKLAIQKKYLWIYDRSELLAHELCHVGRMKFEEPKFEECLAYRTSPSRFRRFFGPLFQSSYESLIFLLIMLVIAVFDFFLISTGQLEGYALALWLKAVPLGLILAATYRLCQRKTCIEDCLKNLEGVFDKEHAEAVLYRLRDKEIEEFSGKSVEFIKDYATKESLVELRWQVIMDSYGLR